MLSAFDEIEVVGETGLLIDAAVDGLMSWAGEGSRLIDANCRVDAISMAGSDMIRAMVRSALKAGWTLDRYAESYFSVGLEG